MRSAALWWAWFATVLGLLPASAVAQAAGARPFVPHELSPFAMQEAAALLRNRLPCLGCHELDGDGGRIGPSLSTIAGRRPPDYVYRMIRDPQQTVPGTIMPRVPMSAATLELIASYLAEHRPASSAAPATPAPSAATAGEARTASGGGDAAALYARSCAPCHGVRGGGDGYNARFLPVRPTAHADQTYMSTRSDDELFDTIFAGGYVMDRSNRMPPFGATLTRDQIWALVHYLRTLCRCQGPAWSLHN